MDRVLNNKKAIIFFLLPGVIMFLVLIIIPIIMSGYYSLQDWSGYGKGTFIGLKNYKDVLSDQIFVRAAINSLILAVASVCIQLPISLLLALTLAKGVKFEKSLVTIYFVPVIISTVVIGQLWMKIYNPEYGLLNVFLGKIGLENLGQAWLGDPKTALVATFIPIIWQYIGYHMLLMYAGIKSISTEIFEAAVIDGSSWWNTSLKITIPMLKPVLNVTVIFAVTGALKVFDLVYVLTGGGPAHASEVIGTLMVSTIFKGNQYGYGSAMAVFIIIECFILSFIVSLLFKEREAVK
ncbi:MAG: carbohydrate ABC transporter permease [Ruminiclostridium sp.]